MGKGGASSGSTATTDPNDLLSTAYTKIMLAICNGEIDDITGQQILLNGTPLLAADGTENFSGVTWDYRKGTQDQSYIQGIPGTENETSVGTDVTTTTPWNIFISNTQLSAIRITLSLAACYEQNTSNGNVTGSKASYVIEVSTDGGSYEALNTGTFDGKCTSTYYRSIRIDLPDASTGWSVRVRRTTADSTSDYIVNAFAVYSYTQVIDAKFRYPLTALLYISFDAKNFSSTPTISVIASAMIKVPDNYDPVTRTYTGTWTGSFKYAVSDNPAWTFYAWLENNLYGLGDRLSASNISLTKYDLYEIAQYCDQLVSDGKGGTGTEPRHRCNAYVQSQEDAYTVLNDFAAIFNGAAYWYSDQVQLTCDRPMDLGFGFNNTNVIGGKFTYAGGSVKNRYSQAVVQYSDPDNHYDDATKVSNVAAYQQRYGVRQVSVTAIGCTRESEANRKGLYYLYTNNLDATVSFQTGLEGNIPHPGMIMPIADSDRAGLRGSRGMGGRLYSSGSNRVFTLDRVPKAVAGDRFMINLPDGTSGSGVIASISGKVVTLTAALAQTPNVDAAWLIDSDELAVQTYKCVSVTDNNDGTFTITGAIYNESKFDAVDTGARLDVKPYTVTPSSVMQVPSNIKISSYSFIEQTLAVTNMRVTWDPVQGAITYQAQWRKDNGDWINAAPNSSVGFEVGAIYSGVYEVRVCAINQGNVSSAWGYAAATTLTGKDGAPGAPENFAATTDQVFAIRYSWTIPDSASDANYTEIQVAQNSDHSDATLLADVAAPTNKYIQSGLKSGQTFYARARIVDKTGNQSPWTDWVTGQSSFDADVIIDQIDASIRDTDVWKELTTEIDLKADQTDLDAAISSATSAINQAKADANSYTDTQLSAATDSVNSALSNLQTTVTQQGSTITSQGNAITSLQNSVSSINTELDSKADASALQTLNNTVTQQGNTLSTQGSDITSLQNSVTTINNTLTTKADASALTSLTNTVTQQGNTLTAQAQQITSLTATIDANTGQINNLAYASLTNALATTQATNQQLATFGNAQANYERVIQTIARNDYAMAEIVEKLSASVDDNVSTILDKQQVISDAVSSQAASLQQISSTVGSNTAAIQTKATTQFTATSGSASYAVNAGITYNGVYYDAGMVIGLQTVDGAVRSTILFNADTFGVYNGTSSNSALPFVITGGQVYIRDAFIADGAITTAKIAGTISSTNYVSGQTGWMLDKSGTLEMNSNSSGNGRSKINNYGIAVYDANGVARFKAGDLNNL